MTYLAAALMLGLMTGVVGKLKGSSFFLWLTIGVLVPGLGLVIVALYRSDKDELRRQCPGCGKVVKLHDALCTRCGTELDFPGEALPSEAMVAERRRRSRSGQTA